MTTIRAATLNDLYAITALAQAMHGESVYKWLPFDINKVRGIIEGAIKRDDHCALVAEREGLIVGMVGAYMTSYICCNDPIVFDLAPFVRGDVRGSLVGVRLIKAMIKWSQDRGARELVCGVTALPPEQREVIYQLYLRLGFHEAGRIFKMRF